jgi:adenylate cyclase
MQRAGNLLFQKTITPLKRSFITEINTMNQALYTMLIELKSFSLYVPMDLLRLLNKSGEPAKLGGKKMEISVLFSDLAHFTSLAEHVSPAELIETLSKHFMTMSACIEDHKGIVDKFIGDAVMALWGALPPSSTHSLDACKTALKMQKKTNDQQLIMHRIGINTGDAIVGNVGSPERMDYTAIGDTVNLAARLESLNKAYGTCIMLGETTARAVQSTMFIRLLDKVTVRGKTQPTLIYELISEKSEADSTKIEAVKIYEEALHFFWNRQFPEAMEQFTKANTLFGGNDLASLMLLERAKTFSMTPPKDSWTGVFVW